MIEVEIKLPLFRRSITERALTDCGFKAGNLVKESDFYFTSDFHDFMNPTPTPPNQQFIIMFNIVNIPVMGVRLSCIPFTEPLDVTVVTWLHRAVPAEPIRISLPSMLPILWRIRLS